MAEKVQPGTRIIITPADDQWFPMWDKVRQKTGALMIGATAMENTRHENTGPRWEVVHSDETDAGELVRVRAHIGMVIHPIAMEVLVGQTGERVLVRYAWSKPVQNELLRPVHGDFNMQVYAPKAAGYSPTKDGLYLCLARLRGNGGTGQYHMQFLSWASGVWLEQFSGFRFTNNDVLGWAEIGLDVQAMGEYLKKGFTALDLGIKQAEAIQALDEKQRVLLSLEDQMDKVRKEVLQLQKVINGG